jgi:hypothetical protein
MNATRIFTLLVACVALRQEAPKPAAPPQPVIPLAASTLAADPDAYLGSTVTVTAPVRQSLGAAAFTIDQHPSSTPAHDVLVLAPLLTAPVTPNGYVTVIGEVIKFDPDTVSSRMKDDAPQLGPDVAARYMGRPALIARSVINASLMDLARRLPPPMSPEEEALSRTMKRVGPAFNAIRAADASRKDEALANATTLKNAFAEIDAFWKAHSRPDAVEWTQQARKESEALEAAARNSQWEDVKAAAGRLQPLCQRCHNTYRDRLEDGTYRLKNVTLK